MGLLVQADPQPEVGRVDVQLRRGLHDVGGHEEQTRLPLGCEVVLPEHFAREKGEHGPHLKPGGARSRTGDGGVQGLGPGRDDGRQGRLEEPAHGFGVGTDPGGPVDDDRGRGVMGGVQARGLRDRRLGGQRRSTDAGHLRGSRCRR